MIAAALVALPAFLCAQFSPTTPLPQALHSHTAVIVNGRLYVAGGVGDGSMSGGVGYLNNVYYCADMNEDGTLGAWRTASQMPEFLGLGLHASVAYNGRIYALGGANLLGQRNTAYFASINADGTLAAWKSTTALPQRVSAHAASVYNGRVYVTGGQLRNTGATALVYSAPFNADGTLGAWRYETSLPSTLFGHKSFARSGRLYVLGGSSASRMYDSSGLPAGSISAAVYSAAVNADGTLGAWQAQPSMPARLDFYALVDTEKSVYVMGGFDGGVVNSVYYSPLASDGSLGDWQPLQALPQNLLALAAASTADYIYSIGGALSYIENPVSGIYFSRIKTDPVALVKLNPTTINKSANGKWVTVIIGLPEAEASAVVADSVRISAVNGAAADLAPDPKWTSKVYSGDSAEFSGMAGVSYMMLKFSRSAVAALIPEGDFSVTLSGRLSDGRVFRGESMNRALTSKKLYTAVTEARAGVRESPSGVKVNIPKGAFKGNPELLLSAAPEDSESVDAGDKDKRSKDMKDRSMSAASEAFEFGPHGTTFDVPVTISLPYSASSLPAGADEAKLKVAYWNSSSGQWELLPSAVSASSKLVSADVSHFSTYQVVYEASAQASSPSAVFSLGEAYVFPNPAAGVTPKLHITATAGDRMSVKVYSVSGRQAWEGSVYGAPSAAGGTTAYELELKGNFPSGVYYYSAEVVSGERKLKKAGKFAVVR